MSSIAKRFFIASLVYFILGLTLQVVAVFDTWVGFNPLAYTAVAATRQILLIGWLTQVALALIYDRWLLLDESKLKSHHFPQREKYGMILFVLFNLGLPLIIIGQPGVIIFGGQWIGAIAAFGGLLQFFAGLIFVREVWNLLKKNSNENH